MTHTVIWKQFGAAITSHRARTLAAYLGHRNSEIALRAESVAFPTIEDFRGDSVFDPNPHQLDIPKDVLETTLLVRTVAVWGPDVVIRSAFTCSELQIKHHNTCRADLVAPRDAAREAVKKFIDSFTNENYNAVNLASTRCATVYEPYEDDPDNSDAQAVWSHLGAPWFAAETAAQEYKLEAYDGPGPREASGTWCKRNTVWAIRAAHAAADWSSHQNVRTIIRKALLDWAVNS